MKTNVQFKIIIAAMMCSVVHAWGQADGGLATPEDKAFKEKTDQGMTPESMDPGDFKDLGEPDPLNPFDKKSETPNTESQTPPPEIISDKSTEEIKKAESAVAEGDKKAESRKKTKRSKKTNKKTKLVSKDPDFGREKRFHQIYKKYNETPVATEVWDQAVGPKKSETYKILKGDNLWSLSKTFFGDSFYWPKIWGLNNDEMYNPHQIDTWMTLRFYPGTMDAPPMMGAITERLPEDPNVEVPKSKRKIHPVLKSLPVSLPAYKYTVKNAKDMTDFSMLKPFSKQMSPPVYLTYFAWDQSLEGSGSVFETELGLKTASDFQYVYLQLESAHPKKIYSVIKEIGQIKGTDYPLIEIQGEVEVIESLPNQEGLYKAIVKKTLMPIEVGARLIAEPLIALNVEPTKIKHIEGVRLLGGEYNTDRKLLIDKSFIFLDGGKQSGLKENMTLEIFAENQVRNPESKIEGAKKKVGLVKVLKVGDSVSTGYMISQTDEIAVGDPVGDRNGQGIVVNATVETHQEEEPSSDLGADSPAESPAENQEAPAEQESEEPLEL